MSLATRLLLRRGLRWTAVACCASALLVLLVDWVELGSRLGGGGPSTLVTSLRLALLLLPGHISRAMPVVAALGAALTVVGLRRSGEWQALAAAGLGPARLLAPFLLIGALSGLGAASLDAWVVPRASRAHGQAMAQHTGQPLRLEGGAWLQLERRSYRLVGEPRSGALERAESYGPGLEATPVVALRWEGEAWLPQDGSDARPWAPLPSPAALAELIGTDAPSARSWTALGADDRPDARAERLARTSRPLASPLAALVAAALCALLGPGSAAVLLATAPVLGWELLATAAQTQAALGRWPAEASPTLRLGLALLVLGLAWRRLRRP